MEINEHFIEIIRCIRDFNGINFFPEKGKLSQTEFRLILEVILQEEKGEEIISSELARRLGITRSAVSQVVTKLEKKGIVKRTASAVDRKIAYIKLSDTAMTAFNEQCSLVNNLMEVIVNDFGEERFNTMLKEFSAFIKAYQEAMKESKDGTAEAKC